MKSLTTRILLGVLCVLLFATIGSQIYYKINDKHNTVEAELCDINEDITFQGIIVRNEKVIKYDGDGVLDYQYQDGNKVSVNSTIANVYATVDDIIAQRKIEKDALIVSDLQRAQNPGTTNYIQPETLKTKIDNEYKQILTLTQKKDYTAFNSLKDDLSVVINIYNLVTGSADNYNERIKSLLNESAKLKQSSKPIDTIKADTTGYFVSYADGYEGKLTYKNAAKLTEDAINKIVNSKIEPVDNVLGKMFNDYSCKIVGILNNDKRIVEGETLQMTTNSSNQIYELTVDSVKPADEDGKVIAVFDCEILDDTMVQTRVRTMKIVFDDYHGIKVPRSAIRFKGDQKGVYVMLGNDIIFKKIDVIYESEDDDFVISKNTSDDEYLLLYDQILLEAISDKDVSSSK
ncbi:MAG: hypothetical protein IJU04_03570 [Ruminococcus sp.]|nr:hypothetical protein [Ruminococcus sp.]